MATFVATADTLLWQSLASVMIPGGTINVIVKASRFAARRASLPVVAAAWGPTGVGLASIPFIIKPIDNAVDYLLDNTTRHWIVPEEKKT
jgi:fission process protein 1